MELGGPMGIEKFLFENFPKMPLWVRVGTYLLLLLVFVYLLLLPRFVDGQLVIRESTSGGVLPYRGADLQIQVDGRPYKFRSNEDGFFSIPLIDRLPQGLEIQVFHIDKSLWFPVEVSVSDVWFARSHRIEVLADKPFIKLATTNTQSTFTSALIAASQWLVSSAYAQSIVLPNTARVTNAQLPAAEKSEIQSEVERTFSKIVGTPSSAVGLNSPLAGSGSRLTYVQRIQLVTTLERKYKMKIPDEHWQQMGTVGQLVDYMQKRKQIERVLPTDVSGNTKTWAQIQQSFPAEAKPIYRKLE